MMFSFGAPPRWVVMWATAIVVYTVLKLLAWSLRSRRPAAGWRHGAFLLAWPGMDADRFLHAGPDEVRPALVAEWLFAASKTVLGLGLLVVARGIVDAGFPWGGGWVAMMGLVFLLHFGLFHLLSCLWRSAGCGAEPIMDWPILARTVSEFWGRRWNKAFRDLARQTLFAPLARALSPAIALIVGFLASGLIHDLVISVPAGGGYGGPTAYFLLQAGAIFVERSTRFRRLARRVPGAPRALSLIVVLGAAPLAFHRPFVTQVIAPFASDLAELLT